MIATDTNILVYAHRSDSEWHSRAQARIESLAQGRVSWGLPWPCIHEFLAVVSHPRIFDPPSSIDAAIDQVSTWLESPVANLLGETAAHWDLLQDELRQGRVRGPLVHDARVAALCIGHGVTEFWTAERDFSRFPGLATRNPLQDRSRIVQPPVGKPDGVAHAGGLSVRTPARSIPAIFPSS